MRIIVWNMQEKVWNLILNMVGTFILVFHFVMALKKAYWLYMKKNYNLGTNVKIFKKLIDKYN